MRPLEETVVLVTGATDGLGRAVAERLAVNGATVLLHGRDPVKLTSAAHQIREAAGEAEVRTYLADFSSLAAVRSLAAEVEAGNHRLHVLINNAGVGSGKPAARAGRRARTATSFGSPSTIWPGSCSPCACCRCCGDRRLPAS